MKRIFKCRYKKLNFQILIIFSCIFLYIIELIPLGATEQDPQTPVNIHKDGGLLKKWLVMAPLTRSGENDTLQKDSLSGFDYDFFKKEGYFSINNTFRR